MTALGSGVSEEDGEFITKSGYRKCVGNQQHTSELQIYVQFSTPILHFLLVNIDFRPSFRNVLRLWVKILGGWVRVMDVFRGYKRWAFL